MATEYCSKMILQLFCDHVIWNIFNAEKQWFMKVLLWHFVLSIWIWLSEMEASFYAGQRNLVFI